MARSRSWIACLAIEVSLCSCVLARYEADPGGAGGAAGSAGNGQSSVSSSVGGATASGAGGASSGPASGSGGGATGTGGQGGKATDPCTGKPLGWYCGGSRQFAYGDSNKLYLCIDEQLMQTEPCLYGCTVMPPGTDDECFQPCAGKMNAWYCGASSDFSYGDPDSRYLCSAGAVIDSELCAGTCQVQQGPQDDLCI